MNSLWVNYELKQDLRVGSARVVVNDGEDHVDDSKDERVDELQNVYGVLRCY